MSDTVRQVHSETFFAICITFSWIGEPLPLPSFLANVQHYSTSPAGRIFRQKIETQLEWKINK